MRTKIDSNTNYEHEQDGQQRVWGKNIPQEFEDIDDNQLDKEALETNQDLKKKMIPQSPIERVQSKRLAQVNAPITVTDIHVKTKGQVGEFNFEESKGEPLPRILSTIDEIAQIANEEHRKSNFDSTGNMKAERKNFVTRIITDEFTFYSHKNDPLSVSDFHRLIKGMEARAQKLPPNLILVLASFPIAGPDKVLHNVVLHVQCGPLPSIHAFEKTLSADKDPVYPEHKKAESLGSQPAIRTMLNSGENVIVQGIPSLVGTAESPIFSVSRNSIVTIKTAGGAEYHDAIDICLEHRFGKAQTELTQMFMREDKDTLQASHLVTSSPINIRQKLTAAKHVLHADPFNARRVTNDLQKITKIQPAFGEELEIFILKPQLLEAFPQDLVKALRIVGENKQSQEGHHTLLKYLQSDSPHLQGIARSALSNIPPSDTESLQTLIKIFEGRNPNYLFAALDIINASRDHLRDLIESSNEEVRNLGNKILHIMDPTNSKLLQTLIEIIEGGNPEHFFSAFNTIKKSRDELIELTEHTSEYVQDLANKALYKLNPIDSDLNQTLRTIIDSGNPEHFLAAIDTINSSRDELAKLQNNPNEEVRFSADKTLDMVDPLNYAFNQNTFIQTWAKSTLLDPNNKILVNDRNVLKIAELMRSHDPRIRDKAWKILLEPYVITEETMKQLADKLNKILEENYDSDLEDLIDYMFN